MTLILGLKTASSIWLLADTRISHPDVKQIEEIPGRLKLITLGPDICVGYAGAADLASTVIRNLPRSASFESIVQELRAASKDGRIDFLVACNSRFELLRIQSGDPLAIDGSIWIGDGEAGSTYEDYELKAILPTPIESQLGPDRARVSRATKAFDNLIRAHPVPTVGGILIRAGSRPDGFWFAQAATAYFPPQTIPSGLSTALYFGGAPEGGFSYSIMAPSVPGIPIVGLYILQGRLGFVYAPLQHDKPDAIANVSQDEFRAYVSSKYGVSIDGPGLG